MNKTIVALLIGIAGISSAFAKDTKADDFSFEINGRIMADLAVFDDDIRSLENGMEFRRARLKFEGTLYQDWGYAVQYDISGNDLAAKDLYISWLGLDNAVVYIGQFKQFFGLAQLTSSKYITFMERPLTSVFDAEHQMGVGYLWADSNMTFGASVYGNEVGEGTQNDGLANYGARFTIAPLATDGNVLHFGFAAAQESFNDTNSVSFEARPESHIAPTLIGATINNADNVTKLGLEAAWVAGPFSLQSEYVTSTVSRLAGFEDATLSGYYVQASWFLTGESRAYKKGSFGRVIPQSESGAWQVAVRMSHLDLVDGSVNGGQMDDLTLGLNYYVNPHVRFMANYIQVEADYGALVDEPSILQFRAQIDF